MSEPPNDPSKDPPKIEFPCDYPIKVFLENEDEGAVADVYTILHRHAPEFDGTDTSIRESRNGRFLSLSIEIVATGEEQLRALHTDLMALSAVRLVL
ncbi:MAG: DUF493 domain-containing protein [Pseudomonadota bacterium]